MTLLELKQELARETNKDADDIEEVSQRRFEAAINRHYKRLASLPGLQHLRDDVTTFDSVAGQAEYSLTNVAKVIRIFDTANRRLLQPLSMAQYRACAPDADSEQGTPTFWIWKGLSGSSSPTYDLYLYQTPSDEVTYTVDYTRVLRALAADDDVPILPPDFHDLLFLGALVDEYRHLDDSRAGQAASQLKQREGQFTYWLHEVDAGSAMVNGGLAQPSRLGPWFPAGS